MNTFRPAAFLLLTFLTACAGVGNTGRGLGVQLKDDAVTYLGSASFCSRPATIDIDVVHGAMSEWQEIKRDGIRPGSARHRLLSTKMHRRLVAACKAAADSSGHDLVVRQGDIRNADMTVDDLTLSVMAKL